MKTLVIAFYFLVAGISPSLATENESEVTEMDLKVLDFELPTSIRLRADISAMQQSEFVKSTKDLGFGVNVEDSRANLSSSVSVYRSRDGVVFLTDNLLMALWVRANNEWKCVVAGLRVVKTMGGAPSALPVRYLGNGFFAVSETLPGDISETSKEGFPQALAATFLIDSNGGKVKERSDAFVYDHNPPVRVPDRWITRYKLKL
jgi:hypothetical protein